MPKRAKSPPLKSSKRAKTTKFEYSFSPEHAREFIGRRPVAFSEEIVNELLFTMRRPSQSYGYTGSPAGPERPFMSPTGGGFTAGVRPPFSRTASSSTDAKVAEEEKYFDFSNLKRANPSQGSPVRKASMPSTMPPRRNSEPSVASPASSLPASSSRRPRSKSVPHLPVPFEEVLKRIAPVIKSRFDALEESVRKRIRDNHQAGEILSLSHLEGLIDRYYNSIQKGAQHETDLHDYRKQRLMELWAKKFPKLSKKQLEKMYADKYQSPITRS